MCMCMFVFDVVYTCNYIEIYRYIRPDATRLRKRAGAGTVVRLAGHAVKVLAPKVKGNQSGWVPYSVHRHMQQCSIRSYVQKTTQNGALPAKIKNPPTHRLQRSKSAPKSAPAFQSAPENRTGAIRSPKTHRKAHRNGIIPLRGCSGYGRSRGSLRRWSKGSCC